jgi:hypothetical protein
MNYNRFFNKSGDFSCINFSFNEKRALFSTGGGEVFLLDFTAIRIINKFVWDSITAIKEVGFSNFEESKLFFLEEKDGILSIFDAYNIGKIIWTFKATVLAAKFQTTKRKIFAVIKHKIIFIDPDVYEWDVKEFFDVL